ncbi:hypothetical protein UPYG_G00276490 [Umbra pygmaea]|uniref:Ependymin n=1 Tax=Umbra pygmaea TaxID=75934 RepID=A0ABD0W6Q8_UMBPY
MLLSSFSSNLCFTCDSITMRSLILVCICLSLVLNAWAQKPRPCASPPLLSGTLTMVNNGTVLTNARFTYDSIGQKVRSRSFSINSNGTSTADLLLLFKEGYYYEILWDRLSCKKRRLDSTFHPMQIPSDADFMAQMILGSSSGAGMGLLVSSWNGTIPESRKSQYIASWVDVGCLPLNMQVFNPDGWFAISMYNILLGIQDPMDFVPPFFCDREVAQESAEAGNFISALQSLAKKL